MLLKRRLDPVEDLRAILVANLKEGSAGISLRFDESIGPSIPWRPHVLDETHRVAWHVLTEYIEPDEWVRRMKKTRAERPNLNLGVALPEEILHQHEDLLEQLSELDARVALRPVDSENEALKISDSVNDVIYGNRLRLTSDAVTSVLDRLLDKCRAAKSNNAKGVTLEVLAAVMLSQVDSFEVKSVGVSSRSQQVDVQIHNRNVGGALGRGPIVLAEAKNWNHPPGSNEYAWFFRKIETKFGMARLGYFLTTDRFTAGVATEKLRDSKGEILVVPLDKKTLPGIWKSLGVRESITTRIESATIEAASQ